MSVLWAVATFCAGVLITLTAPTLQRGTSRVWARPRVRLGIIGGGLMATGFVAGGLSRIGVSGVRSHPGASTVSEFVVPHCKYPVAERGCTTGVVAKSDQALVARTVAEPPVKAKPKPVARQSTVPAPKAETKPLVSEDSARARAFDPLVPKSAPRAALAPKSAPQAPLVKKPAPRAPHVQVSGPRPPAGR